MRVVSSDLILKTVSRTFEQGCGFEFKSKIDKIKKNWIRIQIDIFQKIRIEKNSNQYFKKNLNRKKILIDI